MVQEVQRFHPVGRLLKERLGPLTLHKTAQDGSPVFLIIYVDDMLLSGRHTEELTELVVPKYNSCQELY